MSTVFNPEVLARFPAFRDFVSTIKKTRLMRVPDAPGCGEVWAKCEMEQPQGTIKDRVTCALLWDLLQRRDPEQGLQVLECTGSSLGLSLAPVCRALGLQIKLVVPDTIDESFVQRLTEAGATLELVSIEAGFQAVYQRGMELAEQHPDWAYLGQHKSPVNVEFHRTTTGTEIVEQLDGRRADGWTAAIGTGGTLIGVHLALSAQNPNLKTVAVTPAEMPYASNHPPKPGRKMVGSSGWLNSSHTLVAPYESQLHGHHHAWFHECAHTMMRFHEQTTMRIGSSAAANLRAAYALSRELGPQSTVVTVFPSSAHDEEWEAARDCVWGHHSKR
jgi:cysteine synthase